MTRLTGPVANAGSTFLLTGANAAALAVFATASTWFLQKMNLESADLVVKVALGVMGGALAHKVASGIANRAELDNTGKKVEAGFGFATQAVFLGTVGLGAYHMYQGNSLLMLNQNQEALFLSTMLAGFGLLTAQQSTTLARPDASQTEKRMAGLTLGTALAGLSFIGANLFDDVNPGFAQTSPGWMKHAVGAAGTAAAFGFAVMAGKAVYDMYQAYQVHKAAAVRSAAGELGEPFVGQDDSLDAAEAGQHSPTHSPVGSV